MVKMIRAGVASAMSGRASRQEFARVGVVFYLLAVLLLALLLVKPQLTSMLSGGDEITAEFSDNYKLRNYDSTVKMAGVTVGTVTGIEETDQGTTLVTMKVDDGTVEKLGSDPAANIEPRTLLGGRYAIEVHPGGNGEFDGHIPLEATAIPVELDSIAEALPEDARAAIRGLVGKAGPALRESEDELAALLEHAPDVLAPGAQVLDAARGTRPDQDLRGIVHHLDMTADVLTRKDGQLDSIVRDLDVAVAALAAHHDDLAVVIDELPDTLRDGGKGLAALADTVAQLEQAATGLRPAAPELADLLIDLEPTLKTARPVLRELVPTLRQARPAVQELVPAATDATEILKTLKGPVVNRVSGPVVDFLMNPWEGTGPYAQSAKGYQADHKVYEELAYMATNIDRASMGQDRYGSTLGFQAGVGLNSIHGVPLDLESLVNLALDNAGVTDSALRKKALENAGVQR